MPHPRTAAVIVAAGSGIRAGTSVPKQFVALGGRPMLAHSHAALSNHPAIDEVLVVVAPGQEMALHQALGPVPFVLGGAERRDSVRSALDSLANDPPGRVLIHDAARPFLPAAVIDRLLAALDAHDGAIPVLPIADTLARGDASLGETVPRAGLHRVQTPQAFRFEAVADAHRRWAASAEATDDAQMLRAAGYPVALVEGDALLDKITHPADFAAAEARLAAHMRVRSAQGFDVHRFAEDEELWLGGILVPSPRGLSGHSDADVALHAITDALLGTIGAGDIGSHFPPSDPQWRGASSDRFARHAVALIAARGGIVDFVDLTLICEAPKIGPHRETIRASIAAILGIGTERVSVKATTTERLGFTGRGEGMAAQAIVTVRLPEIE